MLRQDTMLCKAHLDLSARLLSHLCHALVLVHGHELVVHAVHKQDGHGELGVVHLVPLRPVLPAHHGAQHKRGHVESIARLQELFLFGTLTSKASPATMKKRG